MEQDLLRVICRAIVDSKLSPEAIAERADVCAATLYAWLNGDTIHPYITTLEKVAGALGKRITMVDDRWALAPQAKAPPPAKRAPRAQAWTPSFRWTH